VYNSTIGWLPGMTKKEYEDRSVLPINHAKMIDDLIYVHGHEVLVDGYFNAGEFFLLSRVFAALPLPPTNQLGSCVKTTL
jgi:hypothetical protein